VACSLASCACKKIKKLVGLKNLQWHKKPTHKIFPSFLRHKEAFKEELEFAEKKQQQLVFEKEKTNTQKNTLLKTAQPNAATKVFKRVFFSPPQLKLLL
jgi:hypothetical protein